MKAAIFLSVFAAVVLAGEPDSKKPEGGKPDNVPEGVDWKTWTTTTTTTKKEEWVPYTTSTTSSKKEEWTPYTTTSSKKEEWVPYTSSTTSSKKEEWSPAPVKVSSTWATVSMPASAATTWATASIPVKSSSTYSVPVAKYTGAANKAGMVGGAAVGLAAVAFML